jgi:tRNA splicing endonuclease
MSAETIEFLKLLSTELAMVSPVLMAMYLAIQGIKCLLRSEMLNTYYHNKDAEKIRQYELENFIQLYKAYKALRGNSFIDKIYNEVMKWEVIT